MPLPSGTCSCRRGVRGCTPRAGSRTTSRWAENQPASHRAGGRTASPREGNGPASWRAENGPASHREALTPRSSRSLQRPGRTQTLWPPPAQQAQRGRGVWGEAWGSGWQRLFRRLAAGRSAGARALLLLVARGMVSLHLSVAAAAAAGPASWITHSPWHLPQLLQRPRWSHRRTRRCWQWLRQQQGGPSVGSGCLVSVQHCGHVCTGHAWPTLKEASQPATVPYMSAARSVCCAMPPSPQPLF